ncbi:MAG: bifunctional DNA-formamidopyrimidine glycosylase/DNA-(apurinic or apyrimidinic site) lyase [Candidatus Woesebacteria bacterium]|nr:bifunctional DNA-formamidopyrimidine glycosylase/DNA-(apurinic or apyrimidinic site) lyase [Candidatus Woesebacteria bacterium]
MPELPEVEAIKIQLEKFILNKKIVFIDVINRKVFQGDEKKLIGGLVKKVRRFGKVTSIDLSNGYSILTHVKLTGQYIYRGPELKNEILSKKVIGGIPGVHTHLIIKFDKGILYYNDVRRFGWIRVIKTSEVENEPFIKKLGPEPFKNLTFSIFKEILSKTKRNIKTLLMDQSKLSGVGNIYANDALWLSKIDPRRKADSLSGVEALSLFKAVETVLKTGLKYGGASELAFVTPDGGEGQYQNHSLVYGHEGEVCKSCKINKIEKFFLGGRGTYICPVCQK